MAAELPWQDAAEPGPWIAVVRSFHDGHTETWWAAELVYGRYGPQRPVRRLVATTDPRRLPAASSWYLETNLPAPGSKQAQKSPLRAASIAEVVRLYGLRGWIEQSYKQLKNELGWADAMVRAELALRRHWLLIFCAFTFCWLHWLRTAPATAAGVPHQPPLQPAEKKKGAATVGDLAPHLAPGPRVVDAVGGAPALVASLDLWPTPSRTPTVAGLDH